MNKSKVVKKHIIFNEAPRLFLKYCENYNLLKLAKKLDVTRGSIQSTSNELIKSGMVEMQRNPKNKRENIYKLTEKGKKIFAQLEEIRQMIE